MNTATVSSSLCSHSVSGTSSPCDECFLWVASFTDRTVLKCDTDTYEVNDLENSLFEHVVTLLLRSLCFVLGNYITGFSHNTVRQNGLMNDEALKRRKSLKVFQDVLGLNICASIRRLWPWPYRETYVLAFRNEDQVLGLGFWNLCLLISSHSAHLVVVPKFLFSGTGTKLRRSYYVSAVGPLRVFSATDGLIDKFLASLALIQTAM